MLRWNRLAAASRRGFGRSALASGLNVAILAALLPSGAFAAEVPSAYYEVLRQPVTSVDASFVSYAPPVGTQQVSVAIGGGDWFFLDAPDGVQLSVGTYVDAGSSVAPGHPRFDSFACDGPVRSFVVHEVSFNPDRSVATLAVDYDCPGSDQGSLRFHSTWPAQSISAPQIIDYIDVGDTLMPQTKMRTLTITSTGTAATMIDGFDVSGSGATAWSTQSDGCSAVVLEPGETCSVDVVFAPTTGGDHPAELDVRWTPASAPIVMAHLSGHATVPTTTTVSVSPDHVLLGQNAQITLSVSPAPLGASYRVYLDDVFVGTYYADDIYPAHLGFQAPLGQHTVRADYSGQTDFAPSTGTTTFYVVEPTATTLGVSRESAYLGQAVTLIANLTGPAAMSEGTFQIRDDTTDIVLGSTTITATTRSLTVTTSSLALGGHNIVAEYLGTDHYGRSGQSHGVEIDAETGVAIVKTLVSPTTFYPYKDGYLDTATISGVTGEVASVSVNIYNAAGTRVFTKALGNKDGAYSTSWNGRTSSGSQLPVGKYRVVQSFKDTTGHALSVTAYVNLSSKRLYTYTTYLNKTISQAAKHTSSMIGWEFVLPSATVYKSLTFQVYARSSLVPGIDMGGVDFRLCGRSTTWSTSCVASWGGVGGTTAWYSKSLFTTHNRLGRYVRGMVMASGSGVVYKARLKVIYGILK